MGAVVLLAFTAAYNPTEIAAISVMLLLRNPIASGLVIVFALQDSAVEQTTRQTVSPIVAPQGTPPETHSTA